MMELGVQADWARHGGWGRERSLTAGHSRPGTLGFRPDSRPGPAWGWRRERSVTAGPGPALPNFDSAFRPIGPGVGGGGGRGLLQLDRPDTLGFRPDRNEVPSPHTDIDRVVTNTEVRKGPPSFCNPPDRFYGRTGL
jgi:hypothetical protein